MPSFDAKLKSDIITLQQASNPALDEWLKTHLDVLLQASGVRPPPSARQKPRFTYCKFAEGMVSQREQYAEFWLDPEPGMVITLKYVLSHTLDLPAVFRALPQLGLHPDGAQDLHVYRRGETPRNLVQPARHLGTIILRADLAKWPHFTQMSLNFFELRNTNHPWNKQAHDPQIRYLLDTFYPQLGGEQYLSLRDAGLLPDDVAGWLAQYHCALKTPTTPVDPPVTLPTALAD